MIIKSFEVNKLDITKFNLYLFYGKNEGHKNEIIESKFLNKFAGIVNKYDETEFILNFETISSEILTKSLFDEEKIIIVSRASDKILKYIEELKTKNFENIIIILKSSLLEKKSKIRNLFEKNKKLVIIPFYDDNFQTLSSIAVEFLNKNNIRTSREAINLLVNRSSGDRQNLKTELEKILNFSISKKNIDLETVEKLSNLSENYAVNELADSFLSKNKKNISKILNENNYTSEDCILILRTILSKSKRLMGILEKYNETKNLDIAISATKPPIFWKDREIVKKQVITWEIEDLKDNIYKINEVETMAKSNSVNSFNLVSDFIVNY
tara:strand:+ start:25 stop:1002 length:978 start_codon:yes stop_codon:yes gene_type:complete